jgi:uncharacterized protein YndB with AHSA1/START domain
MTDTLQLQIALNAAPDAIFRAWTEGLPAWFAEYADVSSEDKRYDFWGRFTPENPTQEQGRHPLTEYRKGKGLTYLWTVGGTEHTVSLEIQPREDQHVAIVQVNPHTLEDFWFLSLENLRRHLDGKAAVRCDYSQSMLGDVHHEMDIDAPRETVYETLIKPDQLERWIASSATVEPHVGGLYDFGWGGTTEYGMKILEIVPNERLKLLGVMGEQETILTWTLAESNGKTHLTLVHSGFAADQDSGLKAGWLNFMSWVKSISEYGESWEPAIVRLTPDKLSFYPGSIGKGQAVLIP